VRETKNDHNQQNNRTSHTCEKSKKGGAILKEGGGKEGKGERRGSEGEGEKEEGEKEEGGKEGKGEREEILHTGRCTDSRTAEGSKMKNSFHHLVTSSREFITTFPPLYFLFVLSSLCSSPCFIFAS
jgi:hypothetical protein